MNQSLGYWTGAVEGLYACSGLGELSVWSEGGSAACMNCSERDLVLFVRNYSVTDVLR